MCQTNQQGLLWFNTSKGTGWVHNFKIWVCLKIECLKSWCFIGYIRFISPHFQRDPFPPSPHGLLQCWRNGESRANAHEFRIHTHLKSSRDQKHRWVYDVLWAMSTGGFPNHGGSQNVVQKWIYNGISNRMGMAEDLVPQKMCGSDMSSRVYLT